MPDYESFIPLGIGTALQIGGIIFFFYIALQILAWLWIYFLRPATDLRVYGAKPRSDRSLESRSWAIVTGASEGVGLGFARVLAERGFNVVLTSRREDVLRDVAKELEEQHDVQTMVIAADANSDDPAMWQNIMNKVSELDIGFLVNNVGLNTRIPASLVDCTDDEVNRMININVRFSTKLTRLLVPLLARRARSGIINVSSVSRGLPGALLAVYAGTKAYNDIFSMSLSAELRPQHIDVMSITPGYVLSKGNPKKDASFFVISAERHARDALDKMGARLTVTAYWGHNVMEWPAKLLPARFIGEETRKLMVAERNRMLAEDAKAAATADGADGVRR